MDIFCVGFASSQGSSSICKKGKKEKENAQHKIYRFIYLSCFCFEEEHQQQQQQQTSTIINNQKKFVIMDMATTKGIMPIPKFKIPPLTHSPPPTFPPA
jgi:hypothetical protein